jgi:hypothetical protein
VGKLQGNPKVLVVLVEPNTKLGLLAGHGATVFLRAYLPVLSKDPSETRTLTRFVPRLLLAIAAFVWADQIIRSRFSVLCDLSAFRSRQRKNDGCFDP